MIEFYKAMKIKILLVVFSALSCIAQAQDGFPKYYEFVTLYQKGDSLYQAGQYEPAGRAFYRATFLEVEKGIDAPRTDLLFYAACAFAQAGNAPEAIGCLDKLINDFGFTDVDRLETDECFEKVKGKKEWPVILEKVRIKKAVYDAQQQVYQQRTRVSPTFAETVFYPQQSAFIRDLLQQDTLPFVSVNYGGFRIYFSADAFAATHLEALKSEITAAYHRAISILGVESYKRGIYLILFNSVDEMKRISGIKAQGGIAYAQFDAGLFPIHGGRRPQFRHEIFHIISLNTWGQSYSRLLIEGSAVYADNNCFYDNPIYSFNAYLISAQKLLPLQSLIDHFDDQAVKNDLIAYMQSAGVFKYLFEKYGTEKMKKLWVEGFGNFESIYGFSTGRLEQEWTDYMKTIPVPENFDFDRLRDGCG